MKDALEAWAAGEGPAVLARMKQYPPTMHAVIDGSKYHVLGYPEEDDGRIGLWVSKINPRDDYEKAVAEKVLICPDHLMAEESQTVFGQSLEALGWTLLDEAEER